jgi:putative DNA primase/helicase
MILPQIAEIPTVIDAPASSIKSDPKNYSAFEEWTQGSGVSEVITKLNLNSLTDRKVIARNLRWKKYFDEHPLGWWVSGLDLKTMKPHVFGQFKPKTAIQLSPEDEKPAKYLTRKGGYDAIALQHPEEDYWQRVIDDPSIPIVLDEGTKKAGMLMTLGFVALALCGVWMGLKKGGKELVNNLALLAVQGRPITIVFDADLAVNTGVQQALKTLATVLESKGCIVSVAIIPLELESKGIDDVRVNHGEEMVKKIMADAIPYAQWLKNLEAQVGESQPSKARSKIPSSDAMARQIAEDYRNKLAFNNEVLCWYRYEAESSGVWAPETNEYIESIIYQIIKSKGLKDIPPSYIGATVRFLRHELIERKWKSRADLLPFQNGALEIATGKLHPHSPGYKFTWSLPRPHSVLATDWGIISNWLDVATAGNQHIKNILIAYAAATLKGRADIQKFLHLIGIGGSGKGTFCRLLIALIGLENTHSSTLDDWCSNRFEAAEAYGKRLLIFPDEDKGTRSLGKFKQLTGGDWLRAEEKGKKPFKFKFEGMVAVASNFPIFGGDNSSGMSRRTIAVPFDAVIARNARRNLDGDFVPELPAFTNYLLSLDDTWVENILRGVMEVPEVGAQFWESKIREDSIAGFLNDKLILDPLAQVSIGDSPNAEGSLYQAYHQYCLDQGHKPQAVKNFSPNLIECAGVILGWKVEKVHTKIGKIIKGIRIRTKADEHLPTYDYELRSRCEKLDDGFGDGSVTDSVTGQNLEPEPIITTVTDSSYSQEEKNAKNKAQENFDEISSAEVSINPSPENKPLPAKTPDPSPQPSPQPSSIRHPKILFVEQIRKALINFDRSLAVQVTKALKDKIELKKEVRAALTVEEFENFRLLVTVGFVKGTRVKYVGNPKYAEQYEGLELEVYSIDEYSLITCLKPNGAGYTTRLKPEELEKL